MPSRPERSGRPRSEHLVDRLTLENRAAYLLNVSPRPFLRWAGSKRWLLRHLIPLLPPRFGTYWEPFLGSGALFFLLRPNRAVLSDKCEQLMQTYAAVRENASRLISYLRPLRPNRELFYAMRQRPGRGRIKRAAEFLYLNKTCWNGLFRVNSEGHFNVPYGRPKSDVLLDFDNLAACSKTLDKPGIKLHSCDFEIALRAVKPGDLVYLDPPYVTRHDNNGFVDYNETLFSWNDQERLAALAHDLVKAGAYVIVTNANHRDVIRLYPGFHRRIRARISTLASDTRRRGRVHEAILASANTVSAK